MVIALSGKCCSGKNYVSSLFEQKGFKIIDVDVISHKVFKESHNKIVECFGDEIMTNGEINRKKLGKIVFSKKDKREKLESIIHPGVYKEIFTQIEVKGDFVINIPLLTSKELVAKCNYVVWINSPLILRFYRALKRDGYSIVTVIKRIITQIKLNVKHFNWDVDIYSIRNGFNLKKVEKELDKLLIKINRG